MEFSVFYLTINNVQPTFYMQLTASNIGIMYIKRTGIFHFNWRSLSLVYGRVCWLFVILSCAANDMPYFRVISRSAKTYWRLAKSNKPESGLQSVFCRIWRALLSFRSACFRFELERALFPRTHKYRQFCRSPAMESLWRCFDFHTAAPPNSANQQKNTAF